MQKRLEELKSQVKKGNISAAFSLAEAFKWGLGGESDPKNAARMYRICCRSHEKKTAARGYYNLGLLYYYGIDSSEKGPVSDPAKAFSCFLKSSLLYPSREVFCHLGDMYRYGQYVQKNEPVALTLYRKASSYGSFLL